MKGWSIFVHAVRMVLNNIDVALRISAVPYGIVIVATLLLFPSSGIDVLGVNPPTVRSWDGPWIPSVLVVVTSVWIAISWHRFVLLGEVPEGILPRFRAGRTIWYIIGSLIIGLMIFPILYATMIASALSALISPTIGPVIAALLGFLLIFSFGYRVSLNLPAVAIGKRLDIGESTAATRGQTGAAVLLAIITVALLAIILTLLLLLFSLPSLMDIQINPNVYLIYILVAYWIILMFGVSVLTTLYGHDIEGRALD